MQVRVEALEDFLNHKKGDTFGVDEGVAKAWAGAGFVSILGDQPEIKTPDSYVPTAFQVGDENQGEQDGGDAAEKG